MIAADGYDRERDDHFSEVVAVALCDGDGLLAMLSSYRAYIDESCSKDGSIFVVAGYLFHPDKAKLLNRSWRHRFKGRLFHANDVAAGQGEFRGTTASERNGIFRSAVSSVLDNAVAGFVVACSPKEVGGWPGLPGAQSAYGWCCHVCLRRMAIWVEDNAGNARIAYVIESGNEREAELKTFFSYLEKSERRMDEYRYLSSTFTPKAHAPILGTADLLAWECQIESWRAFSTLQGEERRPHRGSLVALLESERVPHFVGHFSSAEITEYLRDWELRTLAGVEGEVSREAVRQIFSGEIRVLDEPRKLRISMDPDKLSS